MVFFKTFKQGLRTSLAVQRLRIYLPCQGMRVQSLVEELRSHKPHSLAKKINTWEKKFFFFKYMQKNKVTLVFKTSSEFS